MYKDASVAYVNIHGQQQKISLSYIYDALDNGGVSGHDCKVRLRHFFADRSQVSYVLQLVMVMEGGRRVVEFKGHGPTRQRAQTDAAATAVREMRIPDPPRKKKMSYSDTMRAREQRKSGYCEHNRAFTCRFISLCRS